MKHYPSGNLFRSVIQTKLFPESVSLINKIKEEIIKLQSQNLQNAWLVAQEIL